MPPMPPSILLYARDEANKEADANKPKEDSKPKEDPKPNDDGKNKDVAQKDSPPNAGLIAGLVTTTVIIAFIVFVVLLPWLRRKREARKKKPKATLPAISRFMNSKSSRFDRSFHGHRRTPSQLDLGPNANGIDQAYLPDNRRPPNDQMPFDGPRGRDVPAVHFNDQPEHIAPPVQMGEADSRPVSYQYYIPPPNTYVETKFPPTPGTAPVTGRSRNGDYMDEPLPSSNAPYHDIGLDSNSPHVPDGHWDQYQGQQSSRTPHRPDTSNGLTPKSGTGNAESASPLTAYINHLNSMNPPATAPVYSNFNAPRSAGLPYQHQQSGRRQDPFHQSAHLRVYPEESEHGLSSGSDYSESPESSSARPGQGYSSGHRQLGYDNTVPHSMPTQGHVSFAHEQDLARAALAKNGAGTALRERFGGLSPQPSAGLVAPKSAALPRSGGLAPMSAALAGPRSAGLGPKSAGFGPRSAGVMPSPGLLSANPKNPASHFSPATPDFRQSRMPLPYNAIPEPPNSSVAYGFALPPSPLSPGDEIVVSPSPYHANFAMNR